MTLQVYSARISYAGPDTFNVTRQSGGEAGEPFAPSGALLYPWLAMRKQARAAAKAGADPMMLDLEHQAQFEDYSARFVQEMRASFRAYPHAWRALLARTRVVLVCYCTNPDRCHRGILRAVILPRLGAQDMGEIQEKKLF